MSKPSNPKREPFVESRKGQYTKQHKTLGRPEEDVRKIRQATNGQPFMSLPKSIINAFELMGIFLNGELYTEPLEINILKREIRVRFKSPEEFVKGDSHSKGKHQVSQT